MRNSTYVSLCLECLFVVKELTKATVFDQLDIWSIQQYQELVSWVVPQIEIILRGNTEFAMDLFEHLRTVRAIVDKSATTGIVYIYPQDYFDILEKYDTMSYTQLRHEFYRQYPTPNIELQFNHLE
jgi:hypothetical protein